MPLLEVGLMVRQQNCGIPRSSTFSLADPEKHKLCTDIEAIDQQQNQSSQL